MRCPHKKKLSAYGDGELSERKTGKIRRHLQDCVQCSQELDRLALVDRALGYIREPEPDPFFASRITSLACKRKPTPIFRRSLIPASAAILGVISIVMGGYLGHNLYSQLADKTEEAPGEVGAYLGTPILQDYPSNSFGDAFGDILEGGD
jgi:anti-sigma factor RsiW